MRFLFLITLFFAFFSNGSAQLPAKLKYDELIYSFDSTTVLIRKGSWTSVYNLRSKSYDIAPTKSALINFPESNIYAEIKPELDLLSIHFAVDGKMMQVFGSLDSCYVGLASPKFGEYFYDYNGEFFEQEINGELLSQTENDLVWTKFEIIKCFPHYYILNHYYDGQMYYVDGADGIQVKAARASGVYNKEVNKWVIEPIYKRCDNLDGFIFCLQENFVKGIPEGDYYVPDRYHYSYDLFQLGFSSSSSWLEDFTQIENQLLSTILTLDTVERCGDTEYYITKKDGKEGFVHFQLFNQWRPLPDFKYTEILAPKFDEVFFEAYFSKLITVDRGAESMLSLYDLLLDSEDEIEFSASAEFILSDSIKIGFGYELMYETNPFVVDSKNNYGFTIDENEKYGLTKYTESDFFDVKLKCGGFQMEFANDSLVVLQNFSGDLISNTQYISTLYPGEDSLDQDGNIVYYIESLGLEKSGVYNLNSKNWQLEPTAKSIRETGAGFLIEYTDRSNERELYEKSVYSFVDFKGNEIFSRIDIETLFSNLEFLKYCFPEVDADSLFRAPNGSKHHTLLKDKDAAYYAVCDSGIGIFEPEINYLLFDVAYFKTPQEFIHVNVDYGFQFWLEGDSIFVEIDSVKKAVSRNQGKIILSKKSYSIEVDYWGDGIELQLINGSDTVLFSNLPEGDLYTNLFRASIEVNGDILIVNDFSKEDNSCVECTDKDNVWYGTYGEFETENSSVWKKVNGQWTKVSPYYAEIIPIPGGYIARTGLFREEYSYYEGRESELIAMSKNVPSRYFFLDSNLRVVPYMDWFDFPLLEDLGFGLKVCYDNTGCFFMTYNRVAVTDAEWNDFELYNKKLKAIKNEVPMLDEYGEQVFDEYGVPVMASESVIMFFKIP